MGRSEDGGTVVGTQTRRHSPPVDESLAQTLAQASVEVDELCATHGITPELLEARQAIESASAALSDFVDGERLFDEESETITT